MERCHRSKMISAQPSHGCLILSKALRLMRSLCQFSAALTVLRHHSPAVSDKSATMGSAKRAASHQVSEVLAGLQGARTGRSVSTPITSPASSFESFIHFCISIIESIIRAMNSSDLSANAADESPADVLGYCDWGLQPFGVAKS